MGASLACSMTAHLEGPVDFQLWGCAHSVSAESVRWKREDTTMNGSMRLPTLEITDLLENYAKSFDLNVYRQYRAAFVRSAISSQDPLLREIVEFATENQVPLQAA